jgi:hypothetical protein
VSTSAVRLLPSSADAVVSDAVVSDAVGDEDADVAVLPDASLPASPAHPVSSTAASTTAGDRGPRLTMTSR